MQSDRETAHWCFLHQVSEGEFSSTGTMLLANSLLLHQCTLQSDPYISSHCLDRFTGFCGHPSK